MLNLYVVLGIAIGAWILTIVALGHTFFTYAELKRLRRSMRKIDRHYGLQNLRLYSTLFSMLGKKEQVIKMDAIIKDWENERPQKL